MKTCFKCKETKPLYSFYTHKKMADGHINKCKKCTKKDVQIHREKNIEKIRECDRNRGSRTTSAYLKEYRKKYKRKQIAHRKVAYRKSTGDLKPQPCEVCGATEKINAHHDDYSKPLQVRWLCSVHHKLWHKENGEGLNA